VVKIGTNLSSTGLFSSGQNIDMRAKGGNVIAVNSSLKVVVAVAERILGRLLIYQYDESLGSLTSIGKVNGNEAQNNFFSGF